MHFVNPIPKLLRTQRCFRYGSGNLKNLLLVLTVEKKINLYSLFVLLKWVSIHIWSYLPACALRAASTYQQPSHPWNRLLNTPSAIQEDKVLVQRMFEILHVKWSHIDSKLSTVLVSIWAYDTYWTGNAVIIVTVPILVCVQIRYSSLYRIQAGWLACGAVVLCVNIYIWQVHRTGQVTHLII